MLLAIFALYVLCQVTTAADKPNILFILADDLGWNDVSWNNENMKTPFLESLRKTNAAQFTRSYVNMLCTQTRSAFMTGKYPFKMGLQEGVFAPSEPAGVPEDLEFFPEFFKQQEYKTYMLGKWHLGHCKSDYLPIKRGFDKFLGFYSGGEDYYTHYAEARNLEGLDFWSQDEPAFGSSYDGKYSTEIYAEQAQTWLDEHNTNSPDSPFFMYLSFQAVRYPLDVPKTYKDNCPTTDGDDRQTFCGMMYALDVAVENVVKKLDTLNLRENTIIIFSTDNGGNVLHGGNNYPYRGNKGTLWEGGSKAVHFVHSPKYISAENTGERNALFHIVDYYATFMNMAGVPTDSYGDGINQWSMITTGVPSTVQRSPADTIVYNIADDGSAIRNEKYKLIVADPNSEEGKKIMTPMGWKLPDGSESSENEESTGIRINGELVDHFLFDLEADYNEKHNLYYNDDYKAEKEKLETALAELKKDMEPSIHQGTSRACLPKNNQFPTGCCEA